MSIGFRFVGLVLLVALLSGGIVSLIHIVVSREALRQEVLNKNLAIAELVADFVSQYMEAVQAHIRVFADRPDIREATLSGASQQLQAALTNFVATQTALEAAGAYDVNGMQFANSDADAAFVGQSFADRKWFQQVMSTGLPYQSTPVKSRSTGNFLIPYPVPVLDPQGRILGVLSGGISLSRLSEHVVNIDVGRGIRGGAIDLRDGGIVMANMNEERIGTAVTGDNEAVNRMIAGESGGSIEIENRSGVTSFVAFTKVPNLPWGIMVITPSATALAVINNLTRNVLISSGFVILLAGALGVIMTRGVTRPLHLLIEATVNIGQGNLVYKAPATARDEIGDLSRSFERMTRNLQETLVSRDTLAKEAIVRGQAEERLRESEELIRLITDNVPGLISHVDKDMIYRFVNAGYHRWFGLKKEDVVGKKVEELLDPAAFQHSLPFIQKALSGEEVTFEGSAILPDGSIKDFANHFVPHVLADGSVDGYFVLVTDITDIKKAEMSLRETEQKLLQSQKLESVGRLAGGVAHDFNNLLTTIIGYSDLISTEPELNETTRESVQEISKSAERAAALTSQLLAFSRKQILQPQLVNLNDLVADLSNMLRRLIGENIDIITKLDSDLGDIKADPGQVEQVIMNLVVNARDAMLSGGILTIETQNVRIDESYRQQHPEVVPGAYILLAVSDTGCGIDEETQNQIFEPFYTTKESGKGTGLGLSTVYGIITQSGGFIWVYSEPDKGAVFKIYLPQVSGKGVEQKRLLAKPIPTGGAETILLVEDDESLRKMGSRILNSYGYFVIEAESGAKAVELVAEKDQRRISLLVTDVIMPKMGGKELSETLLREHPEMKVLFVSGYTDNSIVHQGILDEGVSFLQKPFSPQSLAGKVREILDQA